MFTDILILIDLRIKCLLFALFLNFLIIFHLFLVPIVFYWKYQLLPRQSLSGLQVLIKALIVVFFAYLLLKNRRIYQGPL